MSAYTVRIVGSEDVNCEVRDHTCALNVARAIAIAVAKIRVGELVEVRRGKVRRLAFVGHEARTVEVRHA